MLYGDSLTEATFSCVQFSNLSLSVGIVFKACVVPKCILSIPAVCHSIATLCVRANLFAKCSYLVFHWFADYLLSHKHFYFLDTSEGLETLIL